MKGSLIIVFALVAAVFASDEDEARKVLECFRQALDGGIESINLTNYNPLRPEDQIHVLDSKLVRGTVNYTNLLVEGLVNFTATELVAERDSVSDNVNFNYTLTWFKVRFTGDYAHNISILGLPYVEVKALIDITYYYAHASGNFNVTTGANPRLDDFYFDPSADYVVDVSVIVGETEESAGLKEQQLLHNLFHRSALGDYLSPKIKDYLNKQWLVEGRDRLAAVYQHCKL